MAWIAILAVLCSAGLLWGEHYPPWGRWLGRELPRTGAYTLGVLAIITPLMLLWLIWAAHPPAGNPYFWAIATLGMDVMASGLTVYLLYLVDGRKSEELRRRAAEQEAQVWRDTPDRPPGG